MEKRKATKKPEFRGGEQGIKPRAASVSPGLS